MTPSKKQFLSAFGRARPSSNAERAPQRLVVITVDVEALPERQERSHFDRLVWGRFDGHEAGIRQMVEIGDANGCRLSFLVDFCESALYGRALDEAAEYVVEAGHDLQLHAHPACLPVEFWRERGLSRGGGRLEAYSSEQADALMAFLVERARACGQPRPVAFRGGGFRFNAALLEAMARYDVPLSFNYHGVSHSDMGLGVTVGPFRWSNGVFEFPMTILEFEGRPRAFSFTSRNSLDVCDQEQVRRYLDSYLDSCIGDSVLVMLLHSWSFLDLDPVSRHFVYTDERLVDGFQRLLGGLPQEFEVVTAAELARRLERNEFEIGDERDLALHDRMAAGA